jgi:hypothetical protein
MLGSLRKLLSREPGGTRAPIPDGVRVRRPVFIVGCGRSGTAFLFELLKTYPEIAATTGHPDGEDHVGWMQHGGAIIAGLATPQGDAGHLGYHYCAYMDESDASLGATDAMHRHYASSVLRGDLSRRVLNKCAHLSNKLRYVRAIFPDALFLHIVRDPLAMVASWVKVMQAYPELLLYWPQAEYPCFWVLPATGAVREVLKRDPRFYAGGAPLMLADYWSEVNANIARQLSDAPGQLLTVRYEDLVARTGDALGKIAHFCDLRTPPTRRPEILERRNALYRDLLTDADVRAIRERTRAVAETFGYAQAA